MVEAPSAADEKHELVEAIAVELAARREAFVVNLVKVTRLEVHDLDHADDLAQWLVASIAENTDLLIRILREGVDPRGAEVPPGALQYAVRLARSRVPVPALLRAYRFGQAMFTQLCLDVAGDLGGGTRGVARLDVVRTVVDSVAAFIDHVCEEVGAAYEAESARLALTPGGQRQQLLARLLAGDAIDLAATETALDYPLRGRHVAVVVFSSDSERRALADLLDRIVALVGRELGAVASVAAQTGESEAGAWFAVRDTSEVDAPRVVEALRAEDLPVRLAFGSPAADLPGFRRSYAQAVRTRELAASLDARPPVVTTYPQVAVVALLRDDPVELQAFVARTLGPLAAADERNRGLRETLLVFLEANRLHDRAARRLQVHRNTVRYRVDQAVATRGRSLDDDPLDLMLALAAAKWLGPTVLS